MHARVIGMAMISFKVRPLEVEHTIVTIKMEETMVVGTEYFLILKKRMVHLIQVG